MILSILLSLTVAMIVRLHADPTDSWGLTLFVTVVFLAPAWGAALILHWLFG